MTCFQSFTFPVPLLAASLSLLVGCEAAYKTPGGGAELAIFADDDIRTILEREPVAPMPAHIAIARVQESGYCSYTTRGVGRGRFSLVTNRDVEKEEDLTRLTDLPNVAGVVRLNRLLFAENLDSDRALRRAAAMLHADMLLIYTLDTQFFVDDMFRPLTVVSLGLSPNKQVRVTSTASAVLVDVRTGYVYGACEATARKQQLASAWTSSDAVDHSRLDVEREAFTELLGDFERLWKQIVAERSSAQAK